MKFSICFSIKLNDPFIELWIIGQNRMKYE